MVKELGGQGQKNQVSVVGAVARFSVSNCIPKPGWVKVKKVLLVRGIYSPEFKEGRFQGRQGNLFFCSA